jgi:serine/threonine-protein kinase
MGVVYRARDTRLDRTIAVKSLPPDVALNPVRRAMIEREARVLAALNHPNIATIYGIEPSEFGPVLALEFVEGPTLAEHLANGRLPPDEARAIADQVLTALEAAHAAGVVHRDIKPANLKLTSGGTVKVLDFGIAKTAGPSGAGTTGPVTAAGQVMGTPAYMSPEQARGRPVDRRTDLWAFGCVLYEMFAGVPAFRGETATDTIAAILRAEPDWTRLPESTSGAERRLLRRCLEKDPERRLRDAGDARLELEATDDPGAVPPRPRRAVVVVGAAALLLGGALGAWFGRGARDSGGAKRDTPTRLTIDVPPGLGLSADMAGGCMALSPDGRSIVYSAGLSPATSRLFVRRFDTFDATEIPGTVGATAPCFSPDGKWIAYGDAGSASIRKIRIGGGSSEMLAPASSTSGVCWLTNDTILYTNGDGGLSLVPASGGAPRTITTPRGARDGNQSGPVTPAPDSPVIVYTRVYQDGDRYGRSVDALNLETGQRRSLIPDASQPCCLPGDHLIYYQDGALMAVDFDARRLAVSGEPRRVLSPLAGGEVVPRRRYAVSPTGTLAYLPSTVTYDATDFVWVALDGSITPAHKPSEFIDSLRLSPDGRRLAYSAGTLTTNIWVHDLVRNTTTKVTNRDDRDGCYYPVWTPDGGRIAFQRQHMGLEWTPADGASGVETLYKAPPDQNLYPNSFTPDGKTLVFTMATSPQGPDDLFVMDVAGDRTPRRVFPAPSRASRFGARLSPDGTLIAYTSEESGRMEVYLQPFPALDHKIVVSTDGGLRSAWSGDGKMLYYRAEDRLLSAAVTTVPELAASAPRVLLDHLPIYRYDAAPDGTRFIMAQPPGGSGPQTKINVVLNWAASAGLDRGVSSRP